MVCCADAAERPATKAAAAAPCIHLQVLNMSCPPCAPTPLRFDLFLIDHDSLLAPPSRSGRYDAEPPDERLCHDELAVHDLERQRRQGARRWTGDHGRGIAGIIARIVTGTFNVVLPGDPSADLAACVRTDCRIG